jgi:glycerol-3-phosphate acyltransferase PlsX
MNKHVINLDLHGGDFAPGSVLEGATIALSKNPSIHFKLHSTKEFQAQYSRKFSSLFQKSDWVQSENYISPDLKPSEALKKDNRKSSMSNAIAEIKNNDNEITISAGNTGAMMAYATVYLRTIENISRPAIASLFPSKKHPVCFLDLGANSECTAENLLDFAIMGSTYYQTTLQILFYPLL